MLVEFTVEVVIIPGLGTAGRVLSGFAVVKAAIVVNGLIFDVVIVVTGLVVIGFVVAMVMLVEFTIDDIVTILAMGTVGRVASRISLFEATMVVSGFIFKEVVSVVVVTGLVVKKVMLAEFTVDEVVTTLAVGTTGRVV